MPNHRKQCSAVIQLRQASRQEATSWHCAWAKLTSQTPVPPVRWSSRLIVGRTAKAFSNRLDGAQAGAHGRYNGALLVVKWFVDFRHDGTLQQKGVPLGP